MRRSETFEYAGQQVSYREGWGELAGRLVSYLVVLGVASVPILVAAGLAPHWAWILF